MISDNAPLSPKIDKVRLALDSLRPFLILPRTLSDIRAQGNAIATEQNLTDSQRTLFQKKLKRSLRKLNLKWPERSAPFSTLYSTSEQPDAVYVAMALAHGGYLCNGTALFWNGLTEQVPTRYYIAVERPTYTPRAVPKRLEDSEVQETFMKQPRETTNYAVLGKHRFTILQRESSGQLGVISKKISAGLGPAEIRLTDIERTLIDCAVNPHYSGGVLAVMEAYRAASEMLVLEKFYAYYEALEFIYPYWQRIGFIMEHALPKGASSKWRTYFGEPKVRFYVDRGARTSWRVDPGWNLAYPKALLA